MTSVVVSKIMTRDVVTLVLPGSKQHLLDAIILWNFEVSARYTIVVQLLEIGSWARLQKLLVVGSGKNTESDHGTISSRKRSITDQQNYLGIVISSLPFLYNYFLN
ncbi:MAG: hypothetical protein ACE5OZ_09545 [Candidatus Heimdallarchaeota archaeon]